MKGFEKYTYNTGWVMMMSLILLTSSIFLQGCSKESEVTSHSGSKHIVDLLKIMPEHLFFGEAVIPIETGQEEFYRTIGWMENDTILYLANKNESYTIYEYTLVSGERKQLFKTEKPVISAEISPGRKSILIHSSEGAAAMLTVIDLSGNEVYHAEMDSYELNVEWNQHNEDLIAVTAFTQEWDFQTYIIDLEKKQLEEVDLPEPFVRWISNDELVFQAWEQNGMSLQAPLFIYSTKDLTTRKFLPEVYQFDTMGNHLFTVSVAEENSGLAKYRIYDDSSEMITEFDTPVLTAYSGWLVPFYDLMEKGRDFLYFRPVHGGEADIYEGGFDLISYSLESKREELVLPGLANEPISCSPSGTRCLYGFQFEKVIDIAKKEMFELARQS